MSRRLGRLTIILFVLAVFAQTASFSFLEYDDPINITKNRLLNAPSIQHLETLWKKPHLNLYIPVTYTLWMGISWVSHGLYGRLHPGLFHFTNVLLHLANSLLIYGILILLFRRGSFSDDPKRHFAALFGALVFALHPVQVESVAWATGLKDLLSAFFFLVTIRLILSSQSCPKFRGEPTPRRSNPAFILATLTFLLAILSKPSAVVLPAFIFILIRYVKKEKPSLALCRVLIFWLILAAFDVMLTRTAQPGGPVILVVNRILVAFYVIFFYIEKLIYPHALSIDYGKTISIVLSRPYLWLYPVAAGGFAAAAFFLERRKEILACTALILICISPVLGLVPFTFQRISTVADRYLYLAVFAASIGLAVLLKRYSGRIAILASILLVIFYGLGSIRYVAQWRNTGTIMRHTLAQNPKSVVASHDLGVWLMKQGRMHAAIVFLNKALNLDPANARIHYDLAISYACIGNFSAANQESGRVMHEEPKLGRILSDILPIIKKSCNDGKLPDFVKLKHDHS